MSAAPKRVAISLGHGERDALQQLAHEAGEPVATVAGRLVRAALTDHGAKLDQPPARRAGPPRPRGSKRRPAPTGPTDPIEALRARYPAELRHAPADLSGDTLVAELLSELAHWRADLDAATDPNSREAIAFLREMLTTSTVLQDRARRNR